VQVPGAAPVAAPPGNGYQAPTAGPVPVVVPAPVAQPVINVPVSGPPAS
jgi:hypothetical protein